MSPMKKNTETTMSITTTRGGDAGSLARGLQLLAMMGDAGRPLTLSEISEAVGFASSTTHRLLQTLSQCAHVYKNAQGRYCLAPRALFPLPLDHPLHMLRRDAADMLKNLQARYGPSVLLVVFLGEQRMAIDFVGGTYSVAPYFDTYISAPLHASVSGKILLSDLSLEARDELLGAAPYLARTKQTITLREALDKDLTNVSRLGYATNSNENIAGICAIGAKLTAPSGRALGAIVVTGPSEYFIGDKPEKIKEDVLHAAHMLSNASMSARAVARFLQI